MKRFYLSALSIRQRLSLLICTLLLSVIILFGWISFVGVKKATLRVGEERLQSLAEQLRNMFSDNTHNIISSTYKLANNPVISRFLDSKGRESASDALKELESLRSDSLSIQAELISKEGLPLLTYSKRAWSIDIKADAALLSGNRQARSDSGQVGKIYQLRDSLYYPVMVPVMDGRRLAGYLVRWRTMRATGRSLKQLSQLLGTDAKLYIGNQDGSLWTDLQKPVSFTPVRADRQRSIIEYSFGDRNVIAAVRPIANGPWLVAIELSKDKILKAAHLYLYWMMGAGLFILAAGVFITWIMSRNITSPLVKITQAASAIAAGNYTSMVQVHRYDELGKLARAFNAMTVRVRNSQLELEKRANNYQLLFESNPMPMWIISRSDLSILDVNQAAIDHYGYSREEFLELRPKDFSLMGEEDENQILMMYAARKRKAGIRRHKKKDHTEILVDVIEDDILYKDIPARLILANDVTEKLKMEAELVRHQIMQQEIITETAIQAQEKEREEIGKELHDNINQILASTKLYLELARNGNEDLIPQAISKSYDNVNLAIGEIRQLSKQLVPPILEDMLSNVLKEMTEELQSVTGIHIDLQAEGFDEHIIDDNIKLMIYRIVQEQINNIVKHAQASRVLIRVTNTEESISLTIQDNGVGFDPAQKSKGIGLRNIDNRVKFYKGNATIRSQKENGCTLEVLIPLPGGESK